jgi:hypothetical protein
VLVNAITPERRTGGDEVSALASITHVYVSNDLQVRGTRVPGAMGGDGVLSMLAEAGCLAGLLFEAQQLVVVGKQDNGKMQLQDGAVLAVNGCACALHAA